MPEPPGWMIEEWNLFQAAKWLHVAPWHLAEQDEMWQRRALFYAQVDNGLRNVKTERRK